MRTLMVVLFDVVSAAVFVYGISQAHVGVNEGGPFALFFLLLVPTIFITNRLLGRSGTLKYGQVGDESPSALKVFSLGAAVLCWIYAASLAFGLVAFPGA
jgi:hypothetical protein